MPRYVITGANDDESDHQPLIQKALDEIDDAGGGELFIPTGKHNLGPPGGGTAPGDGSWSLQIGSNTHLRLGANATLVRRFTSSSGLDPTIRNKGLSNNNSYTLT